MYRNAALGSLTFGANLLPKSSRAKKLAQVCPRDVKIGPSGFRKTGRIQNALRDEHFTQLAPKREPQSESLDSFG